MVAVWTSRGCDWLGEFDEKRYDYTSRGTLLCTTENSSGRPALGAHDGGGGTESAVHTVAVRTTARGAFRACHFARVEGNQRALIVIDGARVLTDVAGVVNAPG